MKGMDYVLFFFSFLFIKHPPPQTFNVIFNLKAHDKDERNGLLLLLLLSNTPTQKKNVNVSAYF